MLSYQVSFLCRNCCRFSCC